MRDGRKLQGKTVKRLVQARIPSEPGRRGFWCLERIEFTDGSKLVLGAAETEGDPVAEGTFVDAKGKVHR